MKKRKKNSSRSGIHLSIDIRRLYNCWLASFTSGEELTFNRVKNNKIPPPTKSTNPGIKKKNGRANIKPPVGTRNAQKAEQEPQHQ